MLCYATRLELYDAVGAAEDEEAPRLDHVVLAAVETMRTDRIYIYIYICIERER